jgi:hypothetical protein
VFVRVFICCRFAVACESEETPLWLLDKVVKEYIDVNSDLGPVHFYLCVTFDWSVEDKVWIFTRYVLRLYEVEGAWARQRNLVCS